MKNSIGPNGVPEGFYDTETKLKGRQNMNVWQAGAEQFLHDCEHATAIGHENLQQLLQDNKDTWYGRKYHFDQIQNPDDFQSLVPISEYADYEEAIERMMQGEKNLLTVYDVKHYIMTSGSTGKQKRIPLTKEALKRCSDPIYYAAYACAPGIENGRILHMSVFRMNLSEEEKYTILSAAYFRELHDRGTFDLKERYLGGEELLFSREIQEVPYVKLWIAFSYPDMAGIQAFFLYDILLFLRYFEDNWESVLDDVYTRRIPEDLRLSERVRTAMKKLPVLEEEWYQKIRKECADGFEGIVERLWRETGYVSGVGGSTFTAQEGMLRFYLGSIPIHYFTYAASECMMAVTVRMESKENILMPKSGFFEFLPYNGEEKERPRRMEELEVGAYYELLVTNFSGLYRYRLNDVVKVTGYCGQAPVVEICFRKNQAVNIAGEKMDLQTITEAVNLLAQSCKIHICEYSIYDDKTLLPGRYHCFLETDEKKKAVCFGKDSDPDQLFDDILKKMNEDYLDLRNLGLIEKPSVCQVPAGTHLECKQRFMQGPGNNKPLQYLTSPDIIRFMKERVF